MDPKTESLVFNATKEYVRDNHPALEPYFDDIWKLATTKGENGNTDSSDKQNIGKASFLSDNTIILIVQLVVPFFSGLFSTLIAETVKEKAKSRKKKATVEISVPGDGVVKVEVDVDKKIAKKLLPYAVRALEKGVKQKT